MAASTNGNFPVGLPIISTSANGNTPGGSNPTIASQNHQLIGGLTLADYSTLLAHQSAGAPAVGQPSSDIPDELKAASNGLLSGFSHLELMKLIQQQQQQAQQQQFQQHQQQQARAHQSPFDAQHAAALLQSANAAPAMLPSHLSQMHGLHGGTVGGAQQTAGFSAGLPSAGNYDTTGGNFAAMARANSLNDALRAQLLMNPSIINLPVTRSDAVTQSALNHHLLQQQQLQLLAQMDPNGLMGAPMQSQYPNNNVHHTNNNNNNACRLPQYIGGQMTLASAGSAAFSPNMLAGGASANAQLNGLVLNGQQLQGGVNGAKGMLGQASAGGGSTGSPSLNLSAHQAQQQMMRQRLHTQKQLLQPQQQSAQQRGQQILPKAHPQPCQQQQQMTTGSRSQPTAKQMRLAQASQAQQAAQQQQQLLQQQQQQAANSAANQQRQQQEVYLRHQRQLADYANLLTVQQQRQQQQAASQQQQNPKTLAYQQPAATLSIQSSPIGNRPLLSPDHQMLLQQLSQQHLQQQYHHQQQQEQQHQIQMQQQQQQQQQKRRMSMGNVDAVSRAGGLGSQITPYATVVNGMPATKTVRLNSPHHSSTTATTMPPYVKTIGQKAQSVNSLIGVPHSVINSNGDLHGLVAQTLGVVQATRLTSPALVSSHATNPHPTTAANTIDANSAAVLNSIPQPLAQALVDERFRVFLDNVKLRLLESSASQAQAQLMSLSAERNGAEAALRGACNSHSHNGVVNPNEVVVEGKANEEEEVQLISCDEVRSHGSPPPNPPNLTEEASKKSSPSSKPALESLEQSSQKEAGGEEKITSVVRENSETAVTTGTEEGSK